MCEFCDARLYQYGSAVTGRGWHENPDGFCAWGEPREEA